MREMTLDEVKRTQMEILDFTADFCERNGICYWIDSGTLLGAIRHKGYIPWDDDIDIGMLREDYDRFVKAFRDDCGRFRLLCTENDPGFYLPHGKVCDTSTVLYEPDENGFKLAVNVDVFVYDNAPDDDKELEKMYDARDRYRRICTIKSLCVGGEKNAVKRILKQLRRVAYRMFFPGISVQSMIDNSKKHASEETGRVGNFTAFTRMSCSKKVFDSFIDVEFEEKMYKAPIGYDEWLTSFYGNYMELPPVEKRVAHHLYKAYTEEGI